MVKRPLELFLLRGILNFQPNNSDFDLIAEQDPENSMLKNICARISTPLADELEESCILLGCSKRRFIEMAISNAIFEFHELVEEYDMFGYQAQEAQQLYEAQEAQQLYEAQRGRG